MHLCLLCRITPRVQLTCKQKLDFPFRFHTIEIRWAISHWCWVDMIWYIMLNLSAENADWASFCGSHFRVGCKLRHWQSGGSSLHYDSVQTHNSEYIWLQLEDCFFSADSPKLRSMSLLSSQSETHIQAGSRVLTIPSSQSAWLSTKCFCKTTWTGLPDEKKLHATQELGAAFWLVLGILCRICRLSALSAGQPRGWSWPCWRCKLPDCIDCQVNTVTYLKWQMQLGWTAFGWNISEHFFSSFWNNIQIWSKLVHCLAAKVCVSHDRHLYKDRDAPWGLW